jgi:glutamyl-tRNA reductase
MSSLDEIKKIVEEHLKRELDIFEKVFELNEDDAKTFFEWYMDNTYRKGIEEVAQAVRRGTDKKTKGNRVECRMDTRTEEGN